MLERLASAENLRPVEFGEGRRFDLCDLASTIEGAYGEVLDPALLTPKAVRSWEARLGRKAAVWTGRFSRRFWLTGPTGDVGTIEVYRYPHGFGSVHVSSLYVLPRERHRGHARGALNTVYEQAVAAGLDGICLDTDWVWQRAVTYYLDLGMWATAWKHGLTFARAGRLPPYRVIDAEGALTFEIPDGPLLVARRQGDSLSLTETPLHRRLQAARPRSALPIYALTTFSVHLAVRGHPLIRSPEHWAEARAHCDLGAPEGLAYKIRVFERIAADDGWSVRTPTIPGLPTTPPS
ncbi:hypothetical protein GCM10027589_03670 [Actinocorallia lasiicapitis]